MKLWYFGTFLITLLITDTDAKTILKTQIGTLTSDFRQVGKNCTNVGVLCDCHDVTNVYVCVRSGDNFIKIQMDSCSEGQTCITSEGGCSKKPNVACDLLPNLKMECTSDGMFPDPYNCKKYHICTPESNNDQDKHTTTISPTSKSKFKDHVVTCDDGYGYDALSTFCKIKLKQGECSLSSIHICKGPTLPQALYSNPSLYYMCVKESNSETYHPKLFKCPHGEIFNDGSCGENGSIEPPGSGGIDCQKPKLYAADPINCLFYVDCKKGQRFACPKNQSFNNKTLKCEPGYDHC